MLGGRKLEDAYERKSNRLINEIYQEPAINMQIKTRTWFQFVNAETK